MKARRKTKTKAKDNGIRDGMTITENGTLYFVFGNTRIKITEHFSANGRTIDELLSDYIQKKIKEKAS